MLVLSVLAVLVYFPGRQSILAFKLATGVGVTSLQTRINQLEDKAINGQEFSPSETGFLLDLYACFAKGGALIAPESSKMMHRYLSKTGEPLAVSPHLFTRSKPVRDTMEHLKKQVLEDLDGGREIQDNYTSGTFYMGDPEYFDALVGLYHGHIQVHPRLVHPDSLVLHWRAEVPWTWPTYKELLQKYGDYHAQSFPLPNVRSLIQGSKYCLHMDDGLGGHLPAIGIAKPFLAYSEWEETFARGGRSRSNGEAERSHAIGFETNVPSSAVGLPR